MHCHALRRQLLHATASALVLPRARPVRRSSAFAATAADAADTHSPARHIVTVDNFAPMLISELREVFDSRFADPRRTHAERFLWDYWWCPDAAGTCQYHLVRTQAQVYFSAAQHTALVDALLEYGEAQLGCRAITPIWMSYYVDGMEQQLHCDNPHGPFAFVLSLTHWEGREFSGGETMILQPRVLDYWSQPSSQGLEHADLVKLVPPAFGRLTVFDPRYPHGVRRVRGSQDPRKGRLVLHGWFTDPAPFCSGALSTQQVTPQLDQAMAGAAAAMQEAVMEEGEEVAHAGSHPCSGMLALRLHVDGATGAVSSVRVLADTLMPAPSVGVDSMLVREAITEEFTAWLGDCHFPVPDNGQDSFITVPVMME